MKKFSSLPSRLLPTESLKADIAVVGGGAAGVCFAVAAAREGASVILVQDRPVLGGNASSEVRLWMNGATSHGYNNNRWARESGVMNEIMMHNVYRNPGGNPHILDTIFLELVLAEPNLVLLLNTAIYSVEKSGPDEIGSVLGFNSQNETFYRIEAPLFCDASGDGIVGFLAGGAFRVGAEGKEEFDEQFAPDEAFGQLLGHSIFFYSKDAGRPVPFVAPSFALKDIEKAIPRYRDFSPKEYGPRLWWIEFGGRLDTIFDTEKIKWELWRVVYGVWDYFKNSGKFPETENLTLEWVGTIPGKRESRRFEGDYMLTQKDVIEQRRHNDDVAYGGWALDLHPADGVYSDIHGCTHFHSKGTYPVPYRIMYSRNLKNLFLAGRILSCSHVSFGSLRNMASLGYCGQAAGVAAALCAREKLRPAELSQGESLMKLQRQLLTAGQHIRGQRHDNPGDLALQAEVTASSEYRLQELPADGEWLSLNQTAAQMLPLRKGPVPTAVFRVRARKATTLQTRFLISRDAENFTPETALAESAHKLVAGEEADVTVACSPTLPHDCYGYYALAANPDVEVRCTSRLVTGLLTVFHHHTQNDVNDFLRNGQTLRDVGVENFHIWSPRRRPEGQNLAFRLSSPLACYSAEQVINGVYRPTSKANAWVADPTDADPSISLTWPAPVQFGRVVVDFDPDWDHPMESVIRWHADRAMPYTVQDFQLLNEKGEVLCEVKNNYLARREINLQKPAHVQRLTVRILRVNGPCPAAIFGVGVYPTK